MPAKKGVLRAIKQFLGYGEEDDGVQDLAGARPAPQPAPEPAPSEDLQGERKTPTQPLPPLPGPPPTIQALSRAVEAPCMAAVRPDLGTVNIRSGPGLSYPWIERAEGGSAFGVAGISGPDAEGYAWYWIEWDHGTGWIRKDLVQLSGECADYFLDLPTEPEPEAFQPDPEPGDRFPLPVDYPVIQAYHNRHPAIDLDAPVGTPVEAAVTGVVAACVTCSKCDSEHLAASPSWLTRAQQSEVFEDPAWGYGLGNHVIVRHAFTHLPEALRVWMADRGLRDGYAFVLYGHLSAMHVSPGDEVTAGAVLGASGDTGHTARPSLHLEVRAGEDPEIGDTWQALLPAHPFLMFYTTAR